MVIPSLSSHFSIASLIDASNLLIVFHLSKHCFFHLDDLSCALYDWCVDHLAAQRNNAFARLVGLLLVSATVLTLTVAATGGAGTSSDPLVTLSYLNEKFLPQILSEVDKKTASREQTLSSKLTEQVKRETQAFEQKYGASSGNTSGGTAMSFTVITLNQGQILYMGVGCEAMLRTGSGVCVAASTPGLIDETSGAALAGGLALQQNHLYMATVDSRGVQASANSTKLLVRGNYSVQ